MSFCVECGAEISAAHQFCAQCGAENPSYSTHSSTEELTEVIQFGELGLSINWIMPTKISIFWKPWKEVVKKKKRSSMMVVKKDIQPEPQNKLSSLGEIDQTTGEVVHYKVEIATEGQREFQEILRQPTVTSQGLEMVIDGLDASTVYVVQVTASTSRSFSTPSKIVVRTSDGLPNKLGQPRVDQPTANTLTVSWPVAKFKKNKYLPPSNILNEVPFSYKLEFDDGSKGKHWISLPIKPEIDNSGNCSVLIDKLQPGTEYSFRVLVKNQYGEGKPSKIATALTIGAPTGLSKPSAEKITPTSIFLKWNAPKIIGQKERSSKDEPITYVLEISETKADGAWRKQNATRNCEQVVKDLKANTEYAFRLIAQNNQGESVSKILVVTTKDGLPPQPSTPSVFNFTASSISINWPDVKPPKKKGSEDEDFNYSWFVEINPSGKGTEWKKLPISPIQRSDGLFECTVNDLAHGTTYLLRTGLSNKYGSIYSSPTTATTIGVPAKPMAPNVVAISPLRITISWVDQASDPADPLKYRLQMQKEKEGTFVTREYTETITKDNERQAVLDHLEPGLCYYFRLIAINKQGESEPGKVLSVKTPDGIPGAPNRLKVTDTSDVTVTLSWEEAKGDDGLVELGLQASYIIEYSSIDPQEKASTMKKVVDWIPIQLPEIPKTEGRFVYQVTELKPNTRYAMRVSGKNRLGTGPTCSPLTVDTKGPPSRPNPPVLVKKARNNLDISWKENKKNYSKDVKFILEWDQGTVALQPTAAEWKEIVVPLNEKGHPSFKASIPNLAPGKCYQFRIKTANEYGESEPSKPLIETTLDDVPKVSFTAINSIGIIWGDTLFETKGTEKPRMYSCQYRVSDKPLTEIWLSELIIVEDDQNTFEVTLENLTPETEYVIQVVAVMKDNTASISNSIKVVTLKAGTTNQLSEPRIVDVGKTSFRVRWVPLENSDVTYVVESDEGTRGTTWKHQEVEIKKYKKQFEVLLENLEPGQTYLIRIKVINALGEVISKPAKVTTFAEDTVADIELLKTMSASQLNEMRIIDKRRWFSSRKDLPWFAWVELVVILISILWVIVLHVVTVFPSAVPQLPQGLGSGDIFATLSIVEVSVLCILVPAIFLIRLVIYYMEKEVIRLVKNIVVMLTCIALAFAVLRGAPITLEFVFHILMMVRELLNLVVDINFYNKYFPSRRKKISTTILSLILFTIFVALVVLGIVRIVYKRIQISFNSGLL